MRDESRRGVFNIFAGSFSRGRKTMSPDLSTNIFERNLVVKADFADSTFQRMINCGPLSFFYPVAIKKSEHWPPVSYFNPSFDEKIETGAVGIHATVRRGVHHVVSEAPHMRIYIPHPKPGFRGRYKCYPMNYPMA